MILKPFEWMYHVLSGAKNVLYDWQIFSTRKIPVPVISIGNLSFGGTGKTPFIEFVAQELMKDFKIVIVCRSYKVSSSKPQKVDLNLKNAAETFGDEAVLLQKSLPQVSVWSGPTKWQTAEVAFEQEAPQIILVDDGFSHRQLQRQFDVVLFDATQIGIDYFRESLGSLKRAQAVVFTKTQWALPEKLASFKAVLKQKFPHLVDSIYESQSQTSLDFSNSHPLFVFCGIAKPESFRQSLQALNYKIDFFESYADHQRYDTNLQSAIAESFTQALAKNPQLKLVTTEKDFVKIHLPALLTNLHVASYELQMPTQQKESLLEKMRQNL